jgi:DNA-binding MarR family transcriptional regulator
MTDEPSPDAASLPPALADLTGYLLRRGYLRALAVARDAFPPARQPRQLAVLMGLEATGPCSQRDLAEGLGLNRTLLGRIVDELEERGLVQRERSATDRRTYALRVTPAGLREVARATPEIDRSDAAMTAHLAPEQRRRLNELLRELLASEPGRRLPEGLADRTGYLVVQAHFLMRARADAALRPLGIEVRHFGTLNVIAAAGSCSQQELARGLGVTPPVVVPIVDELEARELVSRERNPADRRSYVVQLTPEGERTLAAARAELELLPAGVFDERQHAGGPELRALLRALLGAGA